MEYKHKYTRLAYTYITYAVAIICGLPMLSSCTEDNDDNPGKPGYDGVPLVILDTDIGSSTDDLSPLEKVLSFEKTQNSFGFLLTYSYLCSPKTYN